MEKCLDDGDDVDVLKYDSRATIYLNRYNHDYNVLPNDNISQYRNYKFKTIHVDTSLAIYGLIALIREYVPNINVDKMNNAPDYDISKNDGYGDGRYYTICKNTCAKAQSSSSHIRNKKKYDRIFSKYFIDD